MALALRFGAVSDIGRVRKKNDDSGYAGPHLLLVADGMGGAPAGDVASTIATQTARQLDTAQFGAPRTAAADGIAGTTDTATIKAVSVTENADGDPWGVGGPPDTVGDEGEGGEQDALLEALAGTVHLANERLAEVIDDDPSIDGMGTTFTAALFDGRRIGLAHLGDSRAYLLREGRLSRLTHDHSWVQNLVDEGRITEQEATTHAYRSMLLKVLDGRHDIEPDLSTHQMSAGDRLLLCSDGLSGFVPEARIAAELSAGSAQMAAIRLTALALDSGSTDNVTVVVGDVVDEPVGGAVASAVAPSPSAIVVGAAADRHRGPLTRLRTWAQRDEPVPSEILVDASIDPEELRYAPRAPRRLLWLRRLIVALVALAIVVAGLAIGYRWTQNQYFVGAANGRVAIYRGVDAELPGITLNHVYQQQSLRLSALPVFRRSQVMNGLAADSLDKAQQIVVQLRGFARACANEESSKHPQTLPTPATSPGSTTSTPGGSTPGGGPSNAPTTTPATAPPRTPNPTATTVGPPPALKSPSSGTLGNPAECAGAHHRGHSR